MTLAPTLPPQLVTPVPGPRSRALAKRLARVESRNVTCLGTTPPIFWERAHGANVWDADGNRFLDMTAAFGVAATGHSHPEIVRAIQQQAETLIHGMGDVHPSQLKVELLEALAERFPCGDGERPDARATLGSSGSDAVEIALKTAMLHTGRPGVIAFEGAYHGLSFGALDLTWRQDFKDPFRARLPAHTAFASFGVLEDTRRAARELGVPVGAVIVEPVQGRGGERIAPPGFLAGLRALCDAEGWLLIADEIYTGLGRTGLRWGCDHERVVPDLLCVGKALASGMPLSACVGRASVMDAWPESSGEALHTQTFLGHPLGCAAALASLRVIDELQLAEHAAEAGAMALTRLREKLGAATRVAEVRGLGLMIGIEMKSADDALGIVGRALTRGVILLPSGDRGNVISLTPPLCIEIPALLAGVDLIVELILELILEPGT